MSKLLKIGTPIVIVLLMLLVVATGIALAKDRDDSCLTRSVAAYTGCDNCTWAGCWNSGGYCPGPCGRGGWYGDNPGNYPQCHGY